LSFFLGCLLVAAAYWAATDQQQQMQFLNISVASALLLLINLLELLSLE